MLTSLVIRIVTRSQRYALAIVATALLCAAGMGWFVVHNFKINTDINQMMSDDLEWRKREQEIFKAFPQKTDLLLVVVDGDTPDAADNAASKLTAKLQAMPDRFTMVQRPEAIPFFRKNGILLLPQEQLAGALNQMVEAQPMLGMMATDPTLHGFFNMIGLMVQGCPTWSD